MISNQVPIVAMIQVNYDSNDLSSCLFNNRVHQSFDNSMKQTLSLQSDEFIFGISKIDIKDNSNSKKHNNLISDILKADPKQSSNTFICNRDINRCASWKSHSRPVAESVHNSFHQSMRCIVVKKVKSSQRYLSHTGKRIPKLKKKTKQDEIIADHTEKRVQARLTPTNKLDNSSKDSKKSTKSLRFLCKKLDSLCAKTKYLKVFNELEDFLKIIFKLNFDHLKNMNLDLDQLNIFAA